MSTPAADFLADAGIVLRDARQAASRSQRDVANESGTRQDHISLVERGLARSVTVAQLDAHARSLGFALTLTPIFRARQLEAAS